MDNNQDKNVTTPRPLRERQGEGPGPEGVLDRVVEVLKTVYDPEIPVNIYDLGLIYRIELNDAGDELSVDMTLTAPNCPAADYIMDDVRSKLEAIAGLQRVDVNLVFEPEWDKDMMSEEAKLELGFD